MSVIVNPITSSPSSSNETSQSSVIKTHPSEKINKKLNPSFNKKNLNKKVKDSEKEDGEIDEDEDGDGDKEVYCICRTSDTNRFMIGCDKCNEWYHGDCISITEEYAKRIQKFYCLMCREKDPNLQIKYKERKGIQKKKDTKDTDKINVQTVKPKPSAPENETSVKTDPDYEPIAKSRKYYAESDADDDDDDDFYEPSSKTKVRKHKDIPKNRKPGRGRPFKGEERKNKPRRSNTRQRHRKNESTKKTHKKNKEYLIEVEEGPKQCYGPECVNAARKGSKYCSDECGIKLATNRIVEVLPHRIRQWQSTPCEADERSHRELEQMRSEQQLARQILAELDVKQKQLEDIINQGKSVPPLTDDDDDNEAESEMSVYCVTCGHEVNHRMALKHMERCFNKYESQTSFGSIFKTKIEGQTVFCDVFNPHQRTYCKRLRILCPEHSKDPKITDDEVCGYPLVTDVFEYTGKFCRILKKKCNRHHCWEKLRRAELDAERIQQWLKLDDLFEKEQKIRFTMANRHGILGLMLHQTIVENTEESEYNAQSTQ